MSMPLIMMDGLGVAGFAAAFWYAGRVYERKKFAGPGSVLAYTAMFAGFLWSITVLLASFFPPFGDAAPWIFAFFIGLLTGLILLRAS
jgi:hypothetical protein